MLRCLCALTFLPVAFAQTPRPSDWLSAGGDAQRSGWEKYDGQFSKATVKDFKVVLQHQFGTGQTLMPPLVIGRLISFKGFKELAIVAASSGHVWALDADLDRIFWERQVPAGSGPACGRVAMPAMMPAPESGPARNASRPLFIVAGDGRLYRLNPATGEDLAPPIAFLPANANAANLAIADNIIYTSTDGSCGAPKLAWSIDVATGKGGHDRLAALNETTWIDDATGTHWVLRARPSAIAAFQGDRQVWESSPIASPAAPVIANGVVFTVGAGGPSGNSVLHALDALTGTEIYSSGNLIAAQPAGTGLALANGRVYFTTKDGTLWAVGLPMNRD